MIGKEGNAMKDIVVKKDDTLLNYLLNIELPYSKSKIRSLLKHYCISVNGVTTTQFDTVVKKNDKITLIEYNPKLDTPLDIIYEDRDLLVINKPNGLLSVPTENQNEISAYHYAKDYVKRGIYVIHRLDKFTSGVLIFAKNEKTQRFYRDDWQKKAPERAYIAMVEGTLDQKEGTIESFLSETKSLHVFSSVSGKEAITHYQTIKSNDRYSALLVHLETGRRNQIRVHMSDLKHPIVGDSKYGAKTNPIKRLALHAYRVKVMSPNSKKVHAFVAPIPNTFHRIVDLKDFRG